MQARVMQRVYVWQLAVRFFHWINALCIVVLGVTGYVIGNPIAFQSSAVSSSSNPSILLINVAAASPRRCNRSTRSPNCNPRACTLLTVGG